MKYLALLRGINVGGNNVIKMAELRNAFERSGFTNVATYITSGNVIFESAETKAGMLTDVLEQALSQTFHFDARLVVKSHDQLKDIVSQVPSEWKHQHDLRCYIAFIKEPTTTQQVLNEIEIKEGIDFVQAGQHVVYLSTRLSGLTKSGFTKLVGKKIYKDMTIRNYSTTQKLLALMEKN